MILELMMKLKIHFSNKKEGPGVTISCPIPVLHIAIHLLPKKIRTVLEKEGIDLSQCRDLVKEKGLNGTLIEIENPNEKIVISVEKGNNR